MTIFSKIGNFFNKNGNTIGKVMTATGATAMGVAGVGMMYESMKSNRSIFGGCGCMPFGTMGYGGFGMPMPGMPMPGMPMPGMPMLGMPMPGMNMGGCSIWGNYGFNPGLSQAWMAGRSYAANGNFNNLNPYGYLNNGGGITTNNNNSINLDEQVRLKEKNYETAELTEGGDKNEGKEFDEALDAMGKSEPDRDKIELEGAKDDYAGAISTAGKNYLKYIDADSDGFITEDEFVKHETDGKLSGLDNAEDLARVAFRKIDQNRDEKIDWKEMGAVIATFDANNDGTITASEFKNKSQKMTQHKNLVFDNSLADNYKNNFIKKQNDS